MSITLDIWPVYLTGSISLFLVFSISFMHAREILIHKYFKFTFFVQTHMLFSLSQKIVHRNIPFILLGIIAALLFFVHRNIIPGLSLMWLAIILSFIFYLPVVLWSNKKPKIGMLMLPKTCVYLWMLTMCLSL